MAVVQYAPRRFFAVSSDSKPAASTGSLLYETDTGARFIYTGSAWVAYYGEDF